MEASELEIIRRAYAKQVMAAAEITGGRVEAAWRSTRGFSAPTRSWLRARARPALTDSGRPHHAHVARSVSWP